MRNSEAVFDSVSAGSCCAHAIERVGLVLCSPAGLVCAKVILAHVLNIDRPLQAPWYCARGSLKSATPSHLTLRQLCMQEVRCNAAIVDLGARPLLGPALVFRTWVFTPHMAQSVSPGSWMTVGRAVTGRRHLAARDDTLASRLLPLQP